MTTTLNKGVCPVAGGCPLRGHVSFELGVGVTGFVAGAVFSSWASRSSSQGWPVHSHFPRAQARAVDDLGDEALVLGFGGKPALLRQLLGGGGFAHGVSLGSSLLGADSLTVRTRSRYPLPVASLKVTGQMPGS